MQETHFAPLQGQRVWTKDHGIIEALKIHSWLATWATDWWPSITFLGIAFLARDWWMQLWGEILPSGLCSLFAIQTLMVYIHELDWMVWKTEMSKWTGWVKTKTDTYQCMSWSGIESNDLRVSFEVFLPEAGCWWQSHFAHPQHCPTKPSSRWNFGRNSTLKPHIPQCSSRRAVAPWKSGCK